jgi:hypothetical protein
MMCIQTLQGFSKPASSEKQLENTLNTRQIIVGEWNQGGVNHYIYMQLIQLRLSFQNLKS